MPRKEKTHRNKVPTETGNPFGKTGGGGMGSGTGGANITPIRPLECPRCRPHAGRTPCTGCAREPRPGVGAGIRSRVEGGGVGEA
jgi:hypothetical protein